MAPKKPITYLLLTAVAGATMSLAALAQTSPASQDRGAVNTQTRQAAAAKTLQPAGEAPDPIGANASSRGAKATTHHHRHGHKNTHRTRSAAQRGPAQTGVQTAEPMTEPKK